MSSIDDGVTLAEIIEVGARVSALRERAAIPALVSALRQCEMYIALARIGLGDPLIAPWYDPPTDDDSGR